MDNNIKTVLTERALAIYKPPFKFESGYFFDSDGNMVADKHEAEAMRVRGWGRISYMPTPEELQDHIGKLIAQAMTELWVRGSALAEKDADAVLVAQDLPEMECPDCGLRVMSSCGKKCPVPNAYAALQSASDNGDKTA